MTENMPSMPSPRLTSPRLPAAGMPSAGDLAADVRQRIARSRPVDAAPGRLLLWVVLAGVVFDVGIRGGLANAVVGAGVAVVAAALLTDGRLLQGEARALALAALAPAVCLAWRASPWLVGTNVAAIAGLVALALLLSRSGSLLDTTPARLVRRSLSSLDRLLLAPFALAPLRHVTGFRARRAARVAQGLVVAGPVLLIVVVLLAAADPVFAGLVSPDIDLWPLAGHVVLAGFFATAALFAIAVALGDSRDGHHEGVFGTTEVVSMLSLAAAVLGLFVVSQLLALTSAGDRLVESAGLTPAEYARSGFFQLCWATALLTAFVAFVGFLAAPGVMERRPVRLLSAAVPFLALGLVAVSLRRMALYDDAFGLTMLRLWVVGATLWMGAVLVMIGLRNLGVGGPRHWVVGGSAAAALLLVVVANALNPEAFVVRHNVGRAQRGELSELDLRYLAGLSDDAVPALVDELGPSALTVSTDGYVRHGDDGIGVVECDDESTGVAALNLAVAGAADARRELC